MKINKKIVIILLFVVAIIFFGIGIFAYFEHEFYKKSNIELSLKIDENNPVINQTSFVTLKRGTIKPGDSGVFTINLDFSGSGSAYVTVEIIRDNLPDDLEFYLDKNYVYKMTNLSFPILKGDYMKENINIYWHFKGTEKIKNRDITVNISAIADKN